MPDALRRAPRTLAPDSQRQGLQLALAVVLAFTVATLTGLPDRYWAVMTVLLVIRPAADATLGAGLSRATATVVGASLGLLGVAVEHAGVRAAWITLPLISVLAFASAANPGLRGAPIGALIVLSAAAMGTRSAIDVALLRLVHVGIGLACALAVGLIGTRRRAEERVRDGCARLLRAVATHTARAAAGPANDDRPMQGTRVALTRLAKLAEDAIRAARLRGRPSSSGARAQQVVGATGRLIQDATVLSRLLALLVRSDPEGPWPSTASAAADVLRRAADAIAGTAPAPSALPDGVAGSGVPAAMLELLVRDASMPAPPTTR